MNTNAIKPLLRAASGALCCIGLMGTVPAQADTVALRYAGPAGTIDTQVLIPVSAAPITVRMGTYNIERQSPAGSFIAYCSDPFQYSNGGFSTYDSRPLASHLAAAPARLADVALLFGNAYAGSLASATRAAGFQLALWEMWHDDKNLDFGIVQATGGTGAAVRAEAQSLLDQLGGWTAGTPYQITVYASDNYQDYVTATPVPEPAAWALMLAGLGLAGGFVLRRRIVPAQQVLQSRCHAGATIAG